MYSVKTCYQRNRHQIKQKENKLFLQSISTKLNCIRLPSALGETKCPLSRFVMNNGYHKFNSCTWYGNQILNVSINDFKTYVMRKDGFVDRIMPLLSAKFCFAVRCRLLLCNILLLMLDYRNHPCIKQFMYTTPFICILSSGVVQWWINIVS